MTTFTNDQAYELLMARWSRRLGRELVRFAGVPDGSRVLDVGCGTGSFADAVLALARPTAVVGIDASVALVEGARARVTDPRARFEAGDAQGLPFADGSFDCAAAMLVLNFVPDPARAAAEMRRVTRGGGIVTACVWDYGGGMTMFYRFWEAAVALDPPAAALHEASMPLRRPGELADLWRAAGLRDVRDGALTIDMDFASFDDYWKPFLGGVGPAGKYAASLPPERQQALERTLRVELWEGRPELPRTLAARAWAVVGNA